MEGTLKSVRSYKKTPATTVPETPEFLQRLLPADLSSPHPSSPNDTRGPLSTTLGSPFNGPGWLDGSSSQPRSDVPAQAWPESPGFGLASGGFGLRIL